MKGMLDALTNRIVVAGHYGSGKTNLSVNLALDLRRQGREVVLADLDIVNPYFRSADFQQLAKENGVRLIAPNYANSNLDIPSLTGELDGCLGGEATLIVDVGGDDAGAYALGRYALRILEQPYDMLYVVNQYRYLTQDPQETAHLLEEIETASRLRASAVVNNSNLSVATRWEDVARSLPYAREVARMTGLPLMTTAVDCKLIDDGRLMEESVYPVRIHVRLPWN